MYFCCNFECTGEKCFKKDYCKKGEIVDEKCRKSRELTLQIRDVIDR